MFRTRVPSADDTTLPAAPATASDDAGKAPSVATASNNAGKAPSVAPASRGAERVPSVATASHGAGKVPSAPPRVDPRMVDDFFDRAFPTVDGCIRRILRGVRADFDALAAAALESALVLLVERAATQRNAIEPAGRAVHLVAKIAATSVALRYLRLSSDTVWLDWATPHDGRGLNEIRRALGNISIHEAELLVLVDVLGVEPLELCLFQGCSERALFGRLTRARRHYLRRRDSLRLAS